MDFLLIVCSCGPCTLSPDKCYVSMEHKALTIKLWFNKVKSHFYLKLF